MPILRQHSPTVPSKSEWSDGESRRESDQCGENQRSDEDRERTQRGSQHDGEAECQRIHPCDFGEKTAELRSMWRYLRLGGEELLTARGDGDALGRNEFIRLCQNGVALGGTLPLSKMHGINESKDDVVFVGVLTWMKDRCTETSWKLLHC